MDDFYSESEQWERLKAWLRSNIPWILGGIAIAVAGLLAWDWYWDRQDRIATEASTKYVALTQALGANDMAKAKTLISEIEREFPGSPYVDQAHMFDARIAVEANDLDKAATLLKGVMDRTKDSQLALVARVRLARVYLAQNKPDDALALLDTKNAGAFAGAFHEVRGDVFFAKGDKSAALKEYELAQASADTGAVDAESLRLKINDLKPDAPPPAAAAEPAAAADPQVEKAAGAQ